MTKDPRHRHPYPKGTKREATPEWKRDVLDWMETHDISYEKLAEMVRKELPERKVDRRGLQKFLTTDQRTGAYVDAIGRITGIGQPMRAAPQDELDRVIERLDQTQRDAVLAFVRTLYGIRLG